MNQTELPIPGGRDVQATLDAPDDGANAAVVACPPHPQHRGHRGDARLVAVSEHLVERGIACLRFDYGPWDEGYGEREDVRNALRWATDRYDRVGIFGFSFGASEAILAVATVEVDVGAVSTLAPTARITEDLDVVAALDDLDCPLQVIYGSRDSTVDWEPVVERARELGHDPVELSADHFFVDRHDDIGKMVADFQVTYSG
jgi:alpha/beta superfamily hydrolase